jgi:hypothetical protein
MCTARLRPLSVLRIGMNLSVEWKIEIEETVDATQKQK